jgi:hypothetical protein
MEHQTHTQAPNSEDEGENADDATVRNDTVVGGLEAFVYQEKAASNRSVPTNGVQPGHVMQAPCALSLVYTMTHGHWRLRGRKAQGPQVAYQAAVGRRRQYGQLKSTLSTPDQVVVDRSECAVRAPPTITCARECLYRVETDDK